MPELKEFGFTMGCGGFPIVVDKWNGKYNSMWGNRYIEPIDGIPNESALMVKMDDMLIFRQLELRNC